MMTVPLSASDSNVRSARESSWIWIDTENPCGL
jgi:hypothetical protein